MLDWQVKITLKSPLLVGGYKIKTSYLKSLPYIPGSVIRAAVARLIVEQCIVYEETEKLFWVKYVDHALCNNCELNFFCRNFEKITFKPAYFEGAKVFPITAMRCKFHSNHKPIDMLISRWELLRGGDIPELPQCPECRKRMESCSGFYAMGNGVYTSRVPDSHTITRLGVDPYRQVADEGLLYSLEVISECQHKNDQFVPTVFIGSITLNETVSHETVYSGYLRLGSKTTSGMGLAEFNLIPVSFEDSIEQIRNRIEKFNAKLTEVTKEKNRMYSPMLLVSDAFLGQVLPGEEVLTTDHYLNIWWEAFKNSLPDFAKIVSLKLEEVFAATSYWRGYDTSLSNNNEREGQLMTLKGSVLILSFLKKEVEQVLQVLLRLEKTGLGKRTEEGYGQVIFCDDFHFNNQ